MGKRDMDVKWLVKTTRRFAVEYAETEVISVESGRVVAIQVTEFGLLELAPAEDWEWGWRGDGEYPHRAYVMIDDVEFFTILTDAEREGLLNGTICLPPRRPEDMSPEELCAAYIEELRRLYGDKIADESRASCWRGWYYIDRARTFPDGSVGRIGATPAYRKARVVEMVRDLMEETPNG